MWCEEVLVVCGVRRGCGGVWCEEGVVVHGVRRVWWCVV